MRKFLLLITTLLLTISLASCGFDPNPNVGGSITPPIPGHGGNGQGDSPGQVGFYSGSFASMSTEIKLSVFDTKANADKYYNEVRDIFDKIDKACNNHFDPFLNPDPEGNSKFNNDIVNLNRNKRNVLVSDITLEVLKFALEMREETNGYYNPFLGRLNRLWKTSIDNKSQPIPSLGEQMLYSHIAKHANLEINGNMVSIIEEPCNCNSNNLMKSSNIDDILIDLGGIAKGYAAQKVDDYFKSIGFRNYLLNAGASNIVTGLHPTNDTYEIGVAFPFPYPNKNYEITKGQDNFVYIDSYKSNVIADKPISNYKFDLETKEIYIIENGKPKPLGNVMITNINAKNIGICTSAPTWQNNDVPGYGLIHHLINPFTGRPENYREQVTVFGQDSGRLDAYSTAMFVMEKEVLEEFIKSKKLQCIIVKDGRIDFNNYEA